VIKHCRLSIVDCRSRKKEGPAALFQQLIMPQVPRLSLPFNHQSSIINHQSGGFTLLEVLVSLAIVGLAVSAILGLFSSNLRAVSASDDYVRASLVAEARIRDVLDTDLAEKTWTEVTNDGYRVDVTISKVQTERAQTIGMDLYQVELGLSWRRGLKNRAINLKTLKLVRPGQETKNQVTS
jgi:type II secretion system protein I